MTGTSIRTVKFALLYLLGILLAGTVGFMAIEKWTFSDAIYMTVITLSTVGFNEMHPLTPGGRFFTMCLIFVGISGMGYAAGTLGGAILEGRLQSVMGRRKVEKRLLNLKGHYIICGGGRVGRMVAESLIVENLPFIIVDRDGGVTQRCDQEGWLTVAGNATEDETLQQAGIDRARGVVACLASDADNVFVTITARQLNPEAKIFARASDESAERKLRSAGAHHVVLAYKIGGLRLAQTILRPNAIDFLEMAIHKRDIDLQIDEIQLAKGAPYVGQTLRETDLRSAYNAIVVALRKLGGKFVFNPEPDHRLEEGDIMIVLGTAEKLDALEHRLGLRNGNV